jgi:hypothetical protein
LVEIIALRILLVRHDHFADLRVISEYFHAFILLLSDSSHLSITYLIAFWFCSSFSSFGGKIECGAIYSLFLTSVFVITVAHEYVLPGGSAFICVRRGGF